MERRHKPNKNKLNWRKYGIPLLAVALFSCISLVACVPQSATPTGSPTESPVAIIQSTDSTPIEFTNIQTSNLIINPDGKPIINYNGPINTIYFEHAVPSKLINTQQANPCQADVQYLQELNITDERAKLCLSIEGLFEGVDISPEDKNQDKKTIASRTIITDADNIKTICNQEKAAACYKPKPDYIFVKVNEDTSTSVMAHEIGHKITEAIPDSLYYDTVTDICYSASNGFITAYYQIGDSTKIYPISPELITTIFENQYTNYPNLPRYLQGDTPEPVKQVYSTLAKILNSPEAGDANIIRRYMEEIAKTPNPKITLEWITKMFDLFANYGYSIDDMSAIDLVSINQIVPKQFQPSYSSPADACK